MRQLHVASAQIVSQVGAAETLPRIDALSQAVGTIVREHMHEQLINAVVNFPHPPERELSSGSYETAQEQHAIG